MNELLLIFIPCMLLVILSDRLSIYRHGEWDKRIYVYREKILFYMAALWMGINAGLRTNYNDTITYVNGYNRTPDTGPIWGTFSWTIGKNPLFELGNLVLRHLGVSAQTFLMLYAVITILIYMWFIHKYAENISLSVYLLFAVGCYTFCFAAIKQCAAVALCLIAIDRVFRRKWISFLFWVILAILMHPYAFMYLIVPFLIFKPWTRRTYILTGALILFGASLEAMLGTIVSIGTMMGEGYVETDLMGEGVNLFRVAVVWAPILLSLFVRRHMRADDDKIGDTFFHLTLLNALIMFVAIFGTANYFARLANYFLIFQTLVIAKILRYFERDSKTLITIFVVVAYFLYFYYANAINMSFDVEYRCIKLGDYLKMLTGIQ